MYVNFGNYLNFFYAHKRSNWEKVLQHLGVLPKEENSAFLTFVIPHDKEGLLTVMISLSTLFYIF